MVFEAGYMYHIYNQGNNRRRIFFNDENYLFFLRKIRTHILPYADILAWCLMPNHFHLMVRVKEVSEEVAGSEGAAPSGALAKNAWSGTLAFNHSIGKMLSSYTQAINKQEGFSGSLFRKETKAECVNCPKGITPSFITKQGITMINITNPEMEYPQICFNYIHNNPVKAQLVTNKTDWQYSSAMDYAGLRNGKLVNKKLAISEGTAPSEGAA